MHFARLVMFLLCAMVPLAAHAGDDYLRSAPHLRDCAGKTGTELGTCVGAVAKSATDCTRGIDTPAERYLCVAIGKKDPGACASLSNTVSRAACETHYGASGPTDAADGPEDPVDACASKSGSAAALCVARSTKSERECASRLTDRTEREVCVAIVKDDVTACDSITNGAAQKACYEAYGERPGAVVNSGGPVGNTEGHPAEQCKSLGSSVAIAVCRGLLHDKTVTCPRDFAGILCKVGLSGTCSSSGNPHYTCEAIIKHDKSKCSRIRSSPDYLNFCLGITTRPSGADECRKIDKASNGQLQELCLKLQKMRKDLAP